MNANPFVHSEITTILVVGDPQKSKEFYIDLLGAELFREYGGDSMVIKFLNHWILLTTTGEPTDDKPDTFFKPPQDKNQVSHAFTIRVDNCQDSYDILKAKGVDFLTPPVTHGAETRCFFRDPDSHLFEISEYRG